MTMAEDPAMRSLGPPGHTDTRLKFRPAIPKDSAQIEVRFRSANQCINQIVAARL